MSMEEIFAADANRERVLLAGSPAVGKTYALLALADFVQLHDPKAKVFVMDADRGMGKVHRAEWPQVENITSYDIIRSWEDVDRVMRAIEPEQTSRDWLLIDMLSRFWEMAQSLEVEAVHGVSPGEAMLQSRKAMVESSRVQAPGSLPQPDWTVIKRFHNSGFIDKISNQWNCHIVATTSLNKLDTDRDDSLLVEIFAPYGYRPDGEKYNSHRFDTITFLQKPGNRRLWTTIKDRGRPLFDKVAFEGSLWESFVATLTKAGYTFADSLQ